MRLIFLVLFSILTLSQVIADNHTDYLNLIVNSEKPAGAEDLPLTLAVDSIHHVNCLYSIGYVQVQAQGGTAPYIYHWSNGIVGPLGNALIPGVYTITVTDGASLTTTLSVEVEENFTYPFADAGNDIEILCAGDPLTINGAGSMGAGFTYLWTASNGGSIASAATTLNPLINHAGDFMLVVTNGQNGCTASAVMVVKAIHESPAATVTGGNLTCIQPQITLQSTYNVTHTMFSWQGPGSFMSPLPNPIVNTQGNYIFTLIDTVTTCVTTTMTAVTSNSIPPVITAASSGAISCINTSATIFANVTPAGATILWSGPNGFSSTALSPLIYVGGVYHVIATNPVNGCTATASTTVNANIILPGVVATGGTITCAITSATLHSSSGTPGVAYAWKGPSNFTSYQANPVVTISGTYTISVTNPSNGCISTATAGVSQNVILPSLTTTGATVTCLTPSPKISASSTTAGVTYSWAGPGAFGSTIFNPNVTSGGIYTITIANPANGCTKSSSVYVTEDKQPPYVFAGTDKSLNCNVTTVIMNPLGTGCGTGCTYLWTTDDGNIVLGANTLYARADAPGAYTLTVKNLQNGCIASDEMDITQSLPVTANATQLVVVTCNGTATGSAKVTGSGVGTLNYTWSNGVTTATATNLSAGTYTVKVADQEACTAVASVTITQPSILVAGVQTTPQTMAGSNNGTASAVVTGGTAPYTYKWNTGPVTMSLSNLAPGNYTVTVTDSNGCTKAQTGTVNSVACSITGSVTATNVSCFGTANGTATVNLTGTSGTVTYIWSNGGNTKTVTNLGPGNYSVTTTDNNGCSAVFTTPITTPQLLVLSLANQNNIKCLGQQTGSATVSASGGTSPYSFVWSTGTSGSTASNLNPGTYSCTVTDAKACTVKQMAQIQLTDHNPPQLALKNATVFLNSSGIATITPALFDNGSIDLECSISSWTVSPTTFDCEQIGTYTVTLTATDQNGNTATGNASVTVKDNIVPTITCPANQTVASCVATVNFSAPVVTDNCQVFSSAILTTGMPSGSVFPSGLTTQVFSFTDYGGNTATCSFTIAVMAAFETSVATTPLSCTSVCNGTASATVSGTNGFANYLWSNGQNNPVAMGLCQGLYTVTVTDAAGCSQIHQVDVLTDNGPAYNLSLNTVSASCNAACDGSLQLAVLGGNSTPFVSWSNGQSGTSLTNLCPGSYQATLTDASGCSQIQEIQIGVHDNQAPTMICPGNIARGSCLSNIVFDMPQVLDNCVVNQQQLQQISGFASGTSFPAGTTIQSFQYTDNGGNVAQCSFMVTVGPISVLQTNATSVTCASACNGTATVSVNSGQGPFYVLWSSGTPGSSVLNLCAGTYTATVTDGSGCTQTATVSVTQPAPLVLGVDLVQNDATGTGTGSISVAISGGVLPYTYTWKRNSQFFAATEDLNGLFAGQYTLAVTDANGCTVGSSALTISTTVATGEVTEILKMVVYPNPARSEVFIQLAGSTDETIQLQILDMQGRILREEMTTQQGNDPIKVNIEDLPEGMLLFRLTNGESAVSKMIVKI